MYGVSAYAAAEYGSVMRPRRAGFNLTRNDAVALTDSTVRVMGRSFSDNVTLTDTILRAQFKTLTDVVTLGSFVLRTMNGFTAGIWERVAKVSTIWTRTPRP